MDSTGGPVNRRASDRSPPSVSALIWKERVSVSGLYCRAITRCTTEVCGSIKTMPPLMRRGEFGKLVIDVCLASSVSHFQLRSRSTSGGLLAHSRRVGVVRLAPGINLGSSANQKLLLLCVVGLLLVVGQTVVVSERCVDQPKTRRGLHSAGAWFLRKQGFVA